MDQRNKHPEKPCAHRDPHRPSDSLAEVVQIRKGSTSRGTRKEFSELEELIWGDSFWVDGYFAETVGKVDEEIVKRYVRNQSRS